MVRIAVAALASMLLLAARADAVLVYQAGSEQHPKVVAARNDGSRARVVAHGFAPRVSPSGHLIAYFTDGHRGECLRVAGNRGRHRHRLACRVFHGDPLAWSPDDRYLITSPEYEGARLVDVRRRTSTHVRGEGNYGGASFTPDGSGFALSLFFDSAQSPPGELTQVDLGSGRQRSLGSGDVPLWGRHGLAFTIENRLLLRKHLDEPPEPILARRAFAVDWSADGNRLLAWEDSQFARRAVLIDLSPRTIRRITQPVFPAALSRDGKTVLGEVDGDVIERFGDGTVRVLAREATHPSWTK